MGLWRQYVVTVDTGNFEQTHLFHLDHHASPVWTSRNKCNNRHTQRLCGSSFFHILCCLKFRSNCAQKDFLVSRPSPSTRETVFRETCIPESTVQDPRITCVKARSKSFQVIEGLLPNSYAHPIEVGGCKYGKSASCHTFL